LTEDELCEEAARDEQSFQATSANVSDVRIERPAKLNVLEAAKDTQTARLSFRHVLTSRWKLNLVTAADTKAAVRAFRQLVGGDKVEINVPRQRS
jgi:hypothetical protein